MGEIVFEYIPPAADNDNTHLWTAVGTNGAIHAWARKDTLPGYHGYVGGVEKHSKTKLYDWQDEPSHEECWLLKCPCWHDGSSSYFSERIDPYLRGQEPFDDAIHSYVFAICADWYQSHFRAEEVALASASSPEDGR